jgi:hypothetical protein
MINPTLTASPFTCYESTFHETGLPASVTTAEGLHQNTVDVALTHFRAYAGTDKMVDSVIIAVYDTAEAIRFFPMNWRNADEKTAMIAGMRSLFQVPELRPDRYCFQGEVWLGSATSRAAAEGLRPSQDPDAIDGLSVLTVGGVHGKPIFTAYARDKAGAVTPYADSRTDGSLDGSEGRLADLLKPLDGESTVGVIVI